MKILMIAVFSARSTNNAQADGFERNGCVVNRYNYRLRAKQMSAKRRDREIITICKRDRPDIVFFSKCNDVNVRVIEECNKYSRTVLWYMDPLRGRGRFTKAMSLKIMKSHYTFCALTNPYKKALSMSPDTVHFVQEGYDELINYPIETPYINDVAFIGALRGNRAAYHKHIGFKVYDGAYGVGHSKAVSETKINLNFTNGGTSDRTYKVLASKGFLLTEPWPNMEEDFTTGEDFDIFSNKEELKDKILYYLKNENKRKKIAKNGYNTVHKFSRTSWAKNILSVVNKDIKSLAVSNR